MDINRILKKIGTCYNIIAGKVRPSFAQFGEDRILEYLFNAKLKIPKPTYLDIGANHPVYGNNTYSFYLNGATGVLIEPDPYLFSLIKKKRKKDKLINAGIGFAAESEADFFVYPVIYKGLNTFSKEEALLRKNEGISYTKVIKMSLLTINSVISENFSGSLDFLSIDVEGLDFDIIQSLDFSLYAPNVICLETLRFGDTTRAYKHKEMIDFVINKGYFIYADTYINTIFCKSTIFYSEG